MNRPANQRQFQRVKVSLTLELYHQGSTTVAQVRDLSEGGAGLSLRRSVPEDVEVKVSLVLAEDGIADPNQPPLECKAKVMWSAENEPGKVAAGIRFVALDEHSRMRIRWFVAQLTEAADS